MENSGSIVVVCRGADDQSEEEHRAADFERGVVAALLFVILPRRLGAVLVFRLRRGNGPVRVRRGRIAMRRGSRRRFVRRNGGAAGLMRRGGRIVMRLGFAGMMRLLRSRFCGRRSGLCRLMVLLRCRLCRRGENFCEAELAMREQKFILCGFSARERSERKIRKGG